MVHTRRKGNRVQLKAIKELQSRGYVVSKAEQTLKFSKERDMFGLFDLVAISPPGKILFLQTTTNRPHTHLRYIKFSAEYPLIPIQQWVWYDNKGWKKFDYNNGEKGELE